MSVIPFPGDRLGRRVLGLSAREWAGYLSLAAALAHAIAVPATWREWWQAAVFFVALALLQGGLAVALLRNLRVGPAALVGVWLNVGVVAVYLVSRVWGFDFAPDRGPHGTSAGAGRPILPYTVESVGVFDFFVLGLEVATIVLLVQLLDTRRARHTSTALMVSAALMAVAVLITG